MFSIVPAPLWTVIMSRQVKLGVLVLVGSLTAARARGITVTFQPRFVFDDLKADTPTGDRARNVIRRRLSEYDAIEQTPLLGSFGETGNLEWTQYFLGDDNQPVDTSRGCPMGHQRQSLTNSPSA